ncbi:MAG: Fe(3+) ABC transporter substrate-binding protein [Opitutae bacterium]|nr:Fe(3+) ABC transporter substrate-binding protein [Opitutae bacterium]MDG1300891.1 Fe(3+) ABC transporter substrate-binding protein [Opitutae bacterium]
MKALFLYGLSLFLFCSASLADTLTIYSYRHYESDVLLFDKFTEETGIDVKVVKSKAGALLERLKAEGDQTPADVLITSDAGRLHQAREAGVLQPIKSPFLEQRVPVNLRDPDGYWYGFTQRARVLVYAPDRVTEDELSTYEDLAAAEWRGRLLVRSSANVYNQSLLSAMIDSNGKEQAREWAQAVRKNMARAPQGSDRDQMRAVAAGLGDVAIVNTYYLGLLANSDNQKDRAVAAQLKVFFPNQSARGTHVNVSGAGIVAGSDHVEAAQQFLEYLATDQAQSVFPGATFEYPVVAGIEWSPLQQKWGTFKADAISLTRLGELNSDAIRCFNLAGWE